MTAAPCVICGTTGGHIGANVFRPVRVDMSRYGVRGRGCANCYARVRYRATHGRDPITGERKPK